MKKIAFINQRYGLEVNGGSEYYTRLMAEHLKDNYEVHVITTKAIDYMSWEDYYQCDEEIINGIMVHRFSVEHPRDINKFNKINSKLLRGKLRKREEKDWINEQGPYCPLLVKYIIQHRHEYDVFIFVTYLYYTTTKGLLEVAEKSIMIPTAHDEPYIDLNIFKQIFCAPRAIVFLTEEEKMYVHKKFKNQNIKNDIIAIGVDIDSGIVDIEKYKRTKKLSDYIVYVGRIDEGKNCPEMFRYFIEYKKRNPSDLKLVLVGKSVIEVPEHKDIISMGFVSEEEKYNAIAGARALILPSKYESLSISVLESLKLGTPIIVNGKCEVLKGHCKKSNAGLYYENYFEFEGCLKYILGNTQTADIMGMNGKNYIRDNYEWGIIVERFTRLIESIRE